MLGQKRLCKTLNKFARHLVMRKSTLSAPHSECYRVIWKKCLLIHLTPSGSYRAAQYAASFPRHVGNFVLDAVIPHGRVGTLSIIYFKAANLFQEFIRQSTRQHRRPQSRDPSCRRILPK